MWAHAARCSRTCPSRPAAPPALSRARTRTLLTIPQDVSNLAETARSAANAYTAALQQQQQLASSSQGWQEQLPQPLRAKDAEVLRRLQVSRPRFSGPQKRMA